jgi:hypothetical protein
LKQLSVIDDIAPPLIAKVNVNNAYAFAIPMWARAIPDNKEEHVCSTGYEIYFESVIRD